jgi:hypothetical protein
MSSMAASDMERTFAEGSGMIRLDGLSIGGILRIVHSNDSVSCASK